ncbi:MAG: insulinase family protein, partial [Hamadaea sp.]|nr:insulinase family protein [Hamadaea sp.]
MGVGRSSGYNQEPGTTVTLEQTEVNGAVTSLVRRTVHPSGLRIVTEQMAGVRSAAIGVFIGVGSRDETARQHGCSHFLEHLLFKGTPSRTALEISSSMDRVGGEFNAYTAKEYTCFHARVLDVDLPLAIDVVGDMLTSSLITAEDVEAERDVILDEIAMHDDDPDDVIHNLVAAQAWGAETPLGRGIAGTEASITALTREEINDFYKEHYAAPRMVVSIAGNVDHDEVVAMVEKAFSGSGFLTPSAAPVPP